MDDCCGRLLWTTVMDDCYGRLGLLHTSWTVAGRFDRGAINDELQLAFISVD